MSASSPTDQGSQGSQEGIFNASSSVQGSQQRTRRCDHEKIVVICLGCKFEKIYHRPIEIQEEPDDSDENADENKGVKKRHLRYELSESALVKTEEVDTEEVKRRRR